jgi:hypothetical protein
MYVISLWMTAVFKKPLSDTLNPLSVSFSSRSPGAFGALIDLKAVADTVLFKILAPERREISIKVTKESKWFQ